MKLIKKNKVAIAFYIVVVAGALLISWNNKQYEKSISANSDYVDIQK